jgi:hypothetical protein
MSGTVRLLKWVMLTIATLAMVFLFALSQSHAGPQHCWTRTVHAGGESNVRTGGSIIVDPLVDTCCQRACTVCVPSSSTMLQIPEIFVGAPVRIRPSSPLQGQIPTPGRHPPRSAA